MCSVLTGVVGGDDSRMELELARDRERAKENEELEERVLERKSELDLDLYPEEERSTTREASGSLAVKNWRISLLRLLRSSLVIPIDWRSWEMGEACGSAICVKGGREQEWS